MKHLSSMLILLNMLMWQNELCAPYWIFDDLMSKRMLLNVLIDYKDLVYGRGSLLMGECMIYLLQVT